MSDLMQKLAVSKKIMDKHNNVPRGQNEGLAMVNENVNATYNIPQDLVNTSQQQIPNISESTTPKPMTDEAVLNSKLPDEIKKLMIENPIVQPQMSGPTLSNDIVEGAARLMKQSTPQQQQIIQENNKVSSNNNDLKQMIRDVVRDTVRDVVKEELSKSGLISEGSQKTNETLSLRVGKHVFEGKVTKIKKVKQ